MVMMEKLIFTQRDRRMGGLPGLIGSIILLPSLFHSSVGAGGQGSSPTSGNSHTTLSDPTTTVFPIQYSGNRRYLVDQNGVPFPIKGRTAWFVTSLSQSDHQLFFDDTVSHGYNAIE